DDQWALEQLLQVYGLTNRAGKSIELTRRILRRNPDDPLTALNLRRALIVSSQEPVITDIFPRLEASEVGQHIIVAGMRKSASTFVSKVISHATGFEKLPLASGFNYTYDFIDLKILEFAIQKNTVSHTHCPAYEENILVIQALGTKPIVVIRNIFDNARSYLDWILNTNYPYETVYKEFRNIPESEHVNFLIDTFIPRQIEFYSSWQYLEQSKRLPIFWASYEEMARDKVAYFESIMSFLNIPISQQAAEQAVKITEKLPNSRLNKGISGRGAELFSDKDKERVKALTRYYPSVDFSRIGL
ncbi:MAG: sulfotransferase domain-containing protein, partial [Rectinemataceae bacterium]|nr:sulfotransferase domain-containing protein [Rectinemataceae bacterium]